MNAALPPGVLDGHGHRRAQGARITVDQPIGVGWASEAKEDGGSHVDWKPVSQCYSRERKDGSLKIIRQNTWRMARGTATRGFLVSVAATATDSTPA